MPADCEAVEARGSVARVTILAGSLISSGRKSSVSLSTNIGPGVSQVRCRTSTGSVVSSRFSMVTLAFWFSPPTHQAKQASFSPMDGMVRRSA